MSESAGGVEIAVRAFPGENGNIPDIGKPFGLRVTSKDGSAVGKILRHKTKHSVFYNTAYSWKRLSKSVVNSILPSG